MLNGKSCLTSGALAGRPISTTSDQAPEETFCCRALSFTAPRAPAIVFAGEKEEPPPVTKADQSSQYVPAGRVVFTASEFVQILRVVFCTIPGGGTTVFCVR